jgi:anti-sigma factor RsiW
MTCEEVRSLQSPYLDSELDAKTTVEIQQHLKSCPDCVSLFAEEQKLEAQLKAGLNQGSRTRALWEQIEGSVGSPSSGARARAPIRVSPPRGWSAVFSALVEQIQTGLRRSPRAWAGLAAAWGIILLLDLAAREPDARPVAGQRVPSAAEMRFAWKQKQLLMADLAFALESGPADESKAAPRGPHSDRQRDNLNT